MDPSCIHVSCYWSIIVPSLLATVYWLFPSCLSLRHSLVARYYSPLLFATVPWLFHSGFCLLTYLLLLFLLLLGNNYRYECPQVVAWWLEVSVCSVKGEHLLCLEKTFDLKPELKPGVL